MPRRPEEESGNCRQRGRHPRPDFRPAERLAAPGCRRFKRGRSCPMGRISRATQPLQVRPKLGGALIAHLAVLLDRLVDDPLELDRQRSEEHTSELQSRENLVCRLLLEKKKYLTENYFLPRLPSF